MRLRHNERMKPDTFPLQLLLATFSGWVNRQQAEAIDYLREENRVLKEQLRGKRLRLTDDQRRRLAAKGKALGRRLLGMVATIVTPDTVLRWHRQLRSWMQQTIRSGLADQESARRSFRAVRPACRCE